MSLSMYVLISSVVVLTGWSLSRKYGSFLYFIFGLLLPLDYLSLVPSSILDLLRYGLACYLILFGARRTTVNRREPLTLTAVSLVFINTGIVLKGWISGHNSYALTGVTGVVSVLTALYLVRRTTDRNLRVLIIGFITSSTLGVLDMASQSLGGVYFGATSEWGTRFSGFSFVSTKTAPLLAIALLFLIANWTWAERRRTFLSVSLEVAVAAVLTYGLYLTVGRGGILGAVVAVVILLLHQHRRLFWSALAFVGFGVAMRPQILQTLRNYFEKEGATDISSGRSTLNKEAWEAFLGNPIFGPGPDTIANLNPHTPLITFAVALGTLGLVLIVMVMTQAVWLGVRPDAANIDRGLVRGGMAIALIVGMLEPAGLYVGLSSILFYMIFLRKSDEGSSPLAGIADPFLEEPRVSEEIDANNA